MPKHATYTCPIVLQIMVTIVNGASASVIFVMEQYDLHCNISTRSGRALDVFNDHSTRYLELEDARFYSHTSSEPVIEVSKTVLVKDNVHLAILVSEDRSKESKFFFAAREKKTMQGVVSLPTVIVKGAVHVKSAVDVPAFLSIEAGSFFPVTNATVLGHMATSAPLESPVVLVKSAAISSMALMRGD